MTYNANEISKYSSRPFELYFWSTADQQWFYTSAAKKTTYVSHIYTPLALSRSEIDQNGEAKSGGLRVTVPRTSDLAALFMAFLPVSPLLLTIYRGHYGDDDSEVKQMFTGKVISAKFGDFCVLTIAPEQYILQQRVPAIQYQQQCPWVVYGPGCELDRNLFRLAGTVSALSANKLSITSSAFAAKPNGWLNAGYIELGNQKRFINSHVGSVVTILDVIPGLIVGSSVAAFAGCMRNNVDCIQKFNNYKRFMGFPNLPGRNPFESGVVGY